MYRSCCRRKTNGEAQRKPAQKVATWLDHHANMFDNQHPTRLCNPDLSWPLHFLCLCACGAMRGQRVRCYPPSLPGVTYGMYYFLPSRVFLSYRANITHIMKGGRKKKGNNQSITHAHDKPTRLTPVISAYYNDCHTARIEASSDSWKSRYCGSLHRIKGCLAFGFQTQTSQSLIINGSKAANSNICLWCDSYRLHGNVVVVYRSKKQGTKSRKLEGGRLKDVRNFQKFESALVLTWRSPVGIHRRGVSMTVTLLY